MSKLERTYFPSWHLGYRCNPFRALTQEEWIDLALLPEGLPEKFDELPALTLILGEQGSGKTSALIALKRELQQRGRRVAYEYLPPRMNSYRLDPGNFHVYLLDEAQRLSGRALNRLLKYPSNADNPLPLLILSTHKDLSQSAASRGIETLRITLENHSAGFILDLIELRLIHFERPGSHGVRLAPSALDFVLTQCNSNLRLLEKLLYEAYQTWDSEGPIPIQHLRKLMIS
jgi:hypothetical protein